MISKDQGLTKDVSRICWANKQLKNLSSTNSNDCELHWGQILSISTKIFPCHSFTATALWIIGQRKAASFLCFVLVPNDVPTRGSGRRNCTPPLVGNWPLKNLLNCNPLPSKLGRVHQEGTHPGQPPPCQVEEELIQFPKEQGEFGLNTTLWQFVQPNTWPPSLRKLWVGPHSSHPISPQ